MKSIQLISILFLTTILSSCFEIIEDVKINADGSGTLKYIINFSQSSDKIKSLLSAGEIDGKKIPNESELKADFEKICNTTKKANGISRVVYTSDFNEFIFTYKADFKNLNNINAAIDSIKSSFSLCIIGKFSLSFLDLVFILVVLSYVFGWFLFIFCVTTLRIYT